MFAFFLYTLIVLTDFIDLKDFIQLIQYQPFNSCDRHEFREILMRKKLLTLLLAVAASVGTMFASTKIGDLYYNLDATNQTAEVTSSIDKYFGAIVIPSSVTYNSVSYSVTSIGSWAFLNCSNLTSVTIPNSVTSIGEYAFDGCTGLTSVTIGNSVTRIGNGAFLNCSNLTSVTIPNSVTRIGMSAFYGCTGLTSVTIGNSVTSIGSAAFWECTGLTSVTIPNSVTSIGSGAFSYCTGLTSVTIPNSVTSIGGYAFSYCSRLTSVTIPNSVTSIGEGAFAGCTGLTSITCEVATPPTLGSEVFSSVDKSIPLYVPAGSIDLYKAAEQWKDFTNILPISQQGLEDVQGNNVQCTKIVHDGQIYILRGDKTYTLTGQEIK